MIIRKLNDEKLVTHFVAKYKKPIGVIYEEFVSELTVYFKPLVISCYLYKPVMFFNDIVGVQNSLVNRPQNFEKFIGFETQ